MKKALLALGVAATFSTVLTQSAQAAPAAQAASAASARSGGWKLMSTGADVDGDGRPDGILLRKKSAQVCQIKLALATGREVTRSTRSADNPCRWHGAATFDPVKGAEISVATVFGAHSAFHTLLTMRNHKLVVEKAPRRVRWVVDSSVMFSEGIVRTHNNAGKLRVVHHSYARENNHRWSGTREVLAWRGGSWKVVTRAHANVKPRLAKKRAGWHVAGLPRWS